MKVQLFPLNTPVPGTPGFVFDELSVQQAIAYTTLPIVSLEEQPWDPWNGIQGGPYFEFEVTSFWIEDGHLWAEVLFFTNGSELFFKENADMIKWFGRVMPRDNSRQMTMNPERNSFTDYYLSSVGWFFK